MEKWAHFNYKSGANPYIAITTKTKNKILKKYKNKIEKIKNNLNIDFYIINDIEETKTDIEAPLF